MRHGPDRGTSLVEVLLATSLAVVVISVLLGSFDSVTRATADHERTLDVRADLRQANAEIGRDLRSISSIAAPPSPLEARSSLTAEVIDSGSRSSTVSISYDRESRTVNREVLDGSGAVASSRVLLRSTDMGADPQMVRYFDAGGAGMDAGAVSGAVLAACTTRIEISLSARRVGAGSATQTLTVASALRSRRPEEASC